MLQPTVQEEAAEKRERASSTGITPAPSSRAPSDPWPDSSAPASGLRERYASTSGSNTDPRQPSAGPAAQQATASGDTDALTLEASLAQAVCSSDTSSEGADALNPLESRANSGTIAGAACDLDDLFQGLQAVSTVHSAGGHTGRAQIPAWGYLASAEASPSDTMHFEHLTSDLDTAGPTPLEASSNAASWARVSAASAGQRAAQEDSEGSFQRKAPHRERASASQERAAVAQLALDSAAARSELSASSGSGRAPWLRALAPNGSPRWPALQSPTYSLSCDAPTSVLVRTCNPELDASLHDSCQ